VPTVVPTVVPDVVPDVVPAAVGPGVGGAVTEASVIRKLDTTRRVSRSTLALSAVAVPVVLSWYTMRGLEKYGTLLTATPEQAFAMTLRYGEGSVQYFHLQ
jgi:hypothetical protein